MDEPLSEISKLLTAGGISGFVAAVVTLRVKFGDLFRRVADIEGKICRAQTKYERSLYSEDGAPIYARTHDFKEQVVKCEARMDKIIDTIEKAIKENKDSSCMVEVTAALKMLTSSIEELKKQNAKNPFGG